MARARERTYDVVAVFGTSAEAHDADQALRRHGFDGARIGLVGDEYMAIRAEQRDEMENTIVGPGNFGPFTKETAKGALIGTTAGGLICAVLAIPLAFLLPETLEMWQRLVIAVAVGGAAGATLGFVAAGGLSARGPAEALAGEAGVTLGVHVLGDEVAQQVSDLLAAQGAIRVDREAAGGVHQQTMATDADAVVHGVADELAARTAQGEGDWSSVRGGTPGVMATSRGRKRGKAGSGTDGQGPRTSGRRSATGGRGAQ